MSYTALYRKFRPACFEDVKGQDHIVTTLKNQVISGRVGHAYLFTGTRGTGKTTVAKIMARTVNCEHPKDGSPCGECDSCKAIANGSSMNVVEIDAASNNGVENVRTIIEEITYAPVDAKYKVYIIDEVHMLSAGAFNALLKTLEEPPAYAIFILATTEVHKIPITILSRCQRYDFRRISVETIAQRMRELMQIEQADVEDRALLYIARVADGSMRDALSLLDQCIAFHYGKTLTYEMALDVLGAVDTEVFSGLYRLILKEDVIGCIDLVDKVLLQGRELGQFVADFVWYLRNLMLLQATADDKLADTLGISAEHFAKLKEEAKMADMNTILRYIAVFSEVSGKMKFAAQKRVMLEVALIRAIKPQMQQDNTSILERLRQLEKKVENGVMTPDQLKCLEESFKGSAGGDTGTVERISGSAKEEDKTIDPQALPEDIQKVIREWNIILGLTGSYMKSALSKADIGWKEGEPIRITFGESMEGDYMSRPEPQAQLQQILDEHIGKHIPFEIHVKKRGEGTDEYTNLLKSIHMTIEEE